MQARFAKPNHPSPMAKRLIETLACLVIVWAPWGSSASVVVTTARRQSLEQWRELTETAAPDPRVFVKGNRIRFYFPGPTNFVRFDANWSHLRVPADGFAVSSGLLKRDKSVSAPPESSQSWEEVTVVAGAAWRRFSTNLIETLTPRTPWHGAYYQAFLSDRALYRDDKGVPHLAPQGEQPKQVIIDRRFPLEETLQVLAMEAEKYRTERHPDEQLFLLMPPSGGRLSQPLLVDVKQRRCITFLPAALLDSADRGLSFAATAQGLGAVIESHTLGIVKNPVSSLARLADLGAETAVVALHLRLPRSTDYPPLSQTNGMDLEGWERWLDHASGTRREDGSLELLIDGDRFFPRFQQAIAEATNHISMNLFIFDRDDVAVKIADQLKQRSAEIPVHVVLDKMGSLTAGLSPPSSPLPEDFVPPGPITDYLRQDSKVHVRPFLNPWFSVNHTKVFLVDGNRAWLGGMNIGREYRYEWHDLMVELQGPVVGSLEKEFARDWAHAGLLGDLAMAAVTLGQSRPDATPADNQWIKVRRLPTRTAWKPFNTAVQSSIRKAQSYIYVENPYLFDKRVITRLVEARKRGVDVRVILPRVNDFGAGGRGNLVTANYLREHGVRVYFFPGMTHVKAMLVDGWACLGSGNLNHLSLRLGQEQNIATSDPAFAAKLKRELFDEDFAHSYELQQSVTVDWVDFLADLILEGF